MPRGAPSKQKLNLGWESTWSNQTHKKSGSLLRQVSETSLFHYHSIAAKLQSHLHMVGKQPFVDQSDNRAWAVPWAVNLNTDTHVQVVQHLQSNKPYPSNPFTFTSFTD